MTSRPRDKAGVPIFNYYRRTGDDEIQATDARLIGLIDSTYISATNRDAFSSNVPSEKHVITTPNADHLPWVHVGNQVVSLCVDGRWGTNDWSQWPQWYYEERDYFAYILRKPSPLELEKHPLRLLWWKMESCHFVSDEGLNAGLLISNIAEGLYSIRQELMKEVRACVCPNGQTSQLLSSVSSKMRAYTSSLRFTPQPFISVLQTVAAAQRYCLETRAVLDKINKWDPMDTTSGRRPTDHKVMGCLTDSIPVAYLMQDKGVPVWFVRSLAQLPDNINIIDERPVVRPAHVGIETKFLVENMNTYVGPISPVMFNAIDNWKPGVLDFRLVGKGLLSEAQSSTPVAEPNVPGSSRAIEALPPAENSRRIEAPAPTENSRHVETFLPTGSSCRIENQHWARGRGGVSARGRGSFNSRGRGSYSNAREGTTPYPTSGRVFQSEGPTTISLNMGLFKPSTSPDMPGLLNAWRDALASIQPDLTLIVKHPNLPVFRGFAFPPPHIFCGENEAINLERLLAWIVVRTGWMGTFADPDRHDIPLPNPQNWRDYLREVAGQLGFAHTRDSQAPASASAVVPPRGPNMPNRASSMAPPRRGKARNPASTPKPSRSSKAREVTKRVFTLQIPSKELLPSLTWHGHIVWRPGQIDIPQFHRKSLLWDIQEHNFRLELTTLDRCLLPAVWNTAEGAAVREEKFSALWPNDVIFMAQLPDSPSGISAEDWQLRALFVEAFRQILVDWPGEIPQQLSSLSFNLTVDGNPTWNRAGMERVEGLAAQHFCQMFFNYFGRPPCVPHILPVA